MPFQLPFVMAGSDFPDYLNHLVSDINTSIIQVTKSINRRDVSVNIPTIIIEQLIDINLICKFMYVTFSDYFYVPYATTTATLGDETLRTAMICSVIGAFANLGDNKREEIAATASQPWCLWPAGTRAHVYDLLGVLLIDKD